MSELTRFCLRKVSSSAACRPRMLATNSNPNLLHKEMANSIKRLFAVCTIIIQLAVAADPEAVATQVTQPRARPSGVLKKVGYLFQVNLDTDYDGDYDDAILVYIARSRIVHHIWLMHECDFQGNPTPDDRPDGIVRLETEKVPEKQRSGKYDYESMPNQAAVLQTLDEGREVIRVYSSQTRKLLGFFLLQSTYNNWSTGTK